MEPFIQSPLGATLIGVALTTLITIAIAAIKMVSQVSSMKVQISNIHEDMKELKSDGNIMRWSDYAQMQMQETPEQRRGGKR